jgi:hypothetical protein
MANERRSLKRFLTEVLGITLGHFVYLCIGGLFSAFSGLAVSQVLATYVGFLSPFKFYLGPVFITGAVWLFIFVYRRRLRSRPSFPRLDFDFELLEREITYQYLDSVHMIYKRRSLLKALRDGLSVYHDKYHWTGEGKVVIRSNVREHMFRETIRKNIWQFYEILFDRTLSKGEKIEAEIIWSLEDTSRRAVPFFSADIEEPTRRLIMNLELSPDLGVRQATREVSSGIGASKPFSSESVGFDRDGKTSWVVEKPRLFHHYEIKWVL